MSSEGGTQLPVPEPMNLGESTTSEIHSGAEPTSDNPDNDLANCNSRIALLRSTVEYTVNQCLARLRYTVELRV